MSSTKIRPSQTYRWARRRGHRHLNQELRTAHKLEGAPLRQVDWASFNVPQARFNIGCHPVRGTIIDASIRRALRSRKYTYWPQLPKSQRRSRNAA